jgi:hypothetical protein
MIINLRPDHVSETWLPGQPMPEGAQPESWCCVDCGFNTAPGCLTRAELEEAFANGHYSVPQRYDDKHEIYVVRKTVWEKTGLAAFGGCLCVGCLEARLGRRLRPKDFQRDHPFNLIPVGTPRLLKRRGRPRGEA